MMMRKNCQFFLIIIKKRGTKLGDYKAMKTGMHRKLFSRLMLVVLCLSLCTTLLTGCGEEETNHATQPGNATTSVAQRQGSAANPSARPIALIYRGPAGCAGCSEAAAALLQSSKWGFDVRYVGPNESLQLSDQTLKMATLYVQPGGDGTVEEAFAYLQDSAPAIRDFIASGGRYLGLCMGGYLAGSDPGFNIIPGDTDEFITTRQASVKTEADTVTPILWRNRQRYMYFQDGPYFILSQGASGVDTLATYTNGKIAALVSPYEKGKVGVVGPHPEATASWYNDYHLTDPDGLDTDLGRDLVDTLMQ
jgi:glutamine amidotransferase-like uncharacterized protein